MPESRSYYSSPIKQFQEENENQILGCLAARNQFDLDDLQRNSWIAQIKILKQNLSHCVVDGHIFFEFNIPRMGKRVDNILIVDGIIFVLEFKVGAADYSKQAIDQVLDYCLDLKNFHQQSASRPIIPVAVATRGPRVKNFYDSYDDWIYKPVLANNENIGLIIGDLQKIIQAKQIDFEAWENSIYTPTPTIVEAAQALYRGHSVSEISRSDAGAINLGRTTDAISKIISKAKKENFKAICFVTGVPGAGKTLAGLNIANNRLRVDENEHAVFLSGNGPLVEVLREALARDQVNGNHKRGEPTTKSRALSSARAFIQNIHHFRDDALQVNSPPVEKVVIFDEAQRAWTLEQTAAFMSRKRGNPDFAMSEPEFLISVMDRHEAWAVIICLVGGGQEINTGEAGLPEWFKALNSRFNHWRVFISQALTDSEYTWGTNILDILKDNTVTPVNDLNLAVSVRSFRSEKVSELFKTILDCDVDRAVSLLDQVYANYPIFLTRDLDTAKSWMRSKARGTERYGLLATSGAYRLKPYGINIQAKIGVVNWFLNEKGDVRSSYALEDAATEFDIQGLELDWACLLWDADLRFSEHGWEYKKFRGTTWQSVNDEIRKLYLKNSYRVLLTRARQGMIIFFPIGDETDPTRSPDFYNKTYEYFSGIGFPTI